MLSWLAPILVFGLVVLVHEGGHFIAAKLLGVYAPRFSIGFGRPIWRRRKGETEYAIGWLPIGGYVRMASREDEATAFLEGGSEVRAGAEGDAGEAAPRPRDWDPEAIMPFGPKPVPPNRWFESKPLWARLIILVAGVTMNAVLALGVSSGLFLHYGRPYRPAVVDSVIADSPAGRAGLQGGDSIVAADGVPVRRFSEVTARIQNAGTRSLQLDVIRRGQRVSLRMVPELVTDTNLVTGVPEQVPKIGAYSTTRIETERLTIPQSAAAGWQATVTMGSSVLQVIGGLVTGKVSVTQLGGPIRIAQTSVEAARSGVETLLSLIAFLSINLSILNLLPIPILDGGQILLHVAEAIKGSAFSTRTREYILRAGLVAIALLFALVMFNDLKRLLSVFG